MAKKKTIIVPDSITLTLEDPQTGKEVVVEEPINFGDFVRRTILRDKKWGEDTEHLFCAMAIRGALKDKVPGDSFELDADEHKMLDEIVSKPSGGYNPEIACQLGTFFDAIKDAK